MTSNIIITHRFDSPCGPLLIGSLHHPSSPRICLCDWIDSYHHTRVKRRVSRFLNAEFVDGNSPLITAAIDQLNEYFAGTRSDFDLPLLLAGSDFQTKVWESLKLVPFGSTVSYLSLARSLGSPESVRAVANAVGANAISILLPCHRVIGHDGRITGYAGGSLAKKFLLALETDFGFPSFY